MTTKEILAKFNSDAINQIRANMISTGANATGKTSRSLHSMETDNSSVIFGNEGFINDAVQVGSPPGTLVKLSDIEEWCVARGISVGRAKRIVKNIYKRGTVSVSPDSPRDIYTSVITDNAVAKLYDSISDVLLNTTASDIEQLITDKRK